MQEFVAVLLVVLIGAAVLYLRSPSAKGAAGESRVNSHLTSALEAGDYRLLRNLTLPAGEGTTQIDHVVLSRYGIFIIETKNMAGWIFGDSNQSHWTQVMRRRKSRFQNPLRQNYKHVKVVQQVLGVKIQQVHNVVAFVGSASARTEMPDNVVWDKQQLVRYIKSRRDACFTDAEVLVFLDRLTEAALEPSRRTDRDHVRNLKNRPNPSQIDRTACPLCGSKMVERSNSKTNATFRGCSHFPKCRGTRRSA